MDGQSIAHELPDRYRALLDRIAALERAGLRRDAASLRTAGIAAYSARWDEPAKRRIVALVGRAERLLRVGRAESPVAPGDGLESAGLSTGSAA